MKRIWAPWRMEYILQARQPGCFLCDMIPSDADRDHLVLKRGEQGVVVMNRYPYNNGHLMIAPYRHVDAPESLSKEESAELWSLTTLSLRVLKETIRPDGFNVGINLGKVAGAGLEEHLHVHLVPRWNGDTNFMPVLADTKVMPQGLWDLWDRLKPAFDKASNVKSGLPYQ